jgi:hypothetical protein
MSEPRRSNPAEPRRRSNSAEPSERGRPAQVSGGGARLHRRTSRPDPRNPAAAGAVIVAAIVLCGAAGLGLGALAGVPVPFALVGLFAGLALGFALVYSRFKDI